MSGSNESSDVIFCENGVCQVPESDSYNAPPKENSAAKMDQMSLLETVNRLNTMLPIFTAMLGDEAPSDPFRLKTAIDHIDTIVSLIAAVGLSHLNAEAGNCDLTSDYRIVQLNENVNELLTRVKAELSQMKAISIKLILDSARNT